MSIAPSQQADLSAFNLSLNQSFNEQFNRDYVKQQELLNANPRLLRTRQSIEAERNNTVGSRSDLSPYELFQEDTLRPTTIRKQALIGIHECNLLSDVFFSAENLEYIQTAIRYQIWLASNKQHVIGRQSDTEIQIIMRSMYLNYGRFLPTSVQQQVKELNDLVVQECVSKALSQIQQHIWYLWQASKNTPWTPIEHPQSMSGKGLKQLPSVTSLFYT